MRYAVNMDPSRPEAMPAMLPATSWQGVRAGYWGGANVYGQPGTVPVYSPAPSAMSDSSWGQYVQPSHCAPNYIMPSEYRSDPTQEWMHTRIQSTNEMPVPAGNPQNMAGVAMAGPQIGGIFQVAQPQATAVFPDVNGAVVQYSNVGYSAFNPGWSV